MNVNFNIVYSITKYIQKPHKSFSNTYRMFLSSWSNEKKEKKISKIEINLKLFTNEILN